MNRNKQDEFWVYIMISAVIAALPGFLLLFQTFY